MGSLFWEAFSIWRNPPGHHKLKICTAPICAQQVIPPPLFPNSRVLPGPAEVFPHIPGTLLQPCCDFQVGRVFPLYALIFYLVKSPSVYGKSAQCISSPQHRCKSLLVTTERDPGGWAEEAVGSGNPFNLNLARCLKQGLMWPRLALNSTCSLR